MRISYLNLIDSLAASALTALTADASYPIENVQDQRLTTTWRSTDPSAQTVIINMGTAQSVTMAAILGHNFTVSSGTLVLSVAGSTSASVFATAETLTWNAGVILKYFDAQSYQYWKFSLTDPTNANGYIEVGRLWLGTYVQVDPSSLVDFTVIKKRSDNVAYGRSRQKFASEGVGWRRFELSFPQTGGSVLDAIQTMYDTAGRHSSLIFCNFDSLRDYPLVEPCYCSIQDDIAFTHAQSMHFRYGLVLEEDK